MPRKLIIMSAVTLASLVLSFGIPTRAAYSHSSAVVIPPAIERDQSSGGTTKIICLNINVQPDAYYRGLPFATLESVDDEGCSAASAVFYEHLYPLGIVGNFVVVMGAVYIGIKVRELILRRNK